MAKKNSPENLKKIDELMSKEIRNNRIFVKEEFPVSYTVKHVCIDECEYDYIRSVEKAPWKGYVKQYIHYDGELISLSGWKSPKEIKENYPLAQDQVNEEKKENVLRLIRWNVLFKRGNEVCLNPGSYYPTYEVTYIDFDGIEKKYRYSVDATKNW